MSWPATVRYGLEAAPGNLALVQDFVNTIPAGTPRGADLLADVPTAQAWLQDVLAEWCKARDAVPDAVTLTATDIGRLRSLRAEFVDLIRAGEVRPDRDRRDWRMISVASTLRLDQTGRVHALPSGNGWRYVASVLLMEALEAQLGDTWRRLKTCFNPSCSAAFFDRSRNNSRVWHDVAVCGNLANLHAYRARKRAQRGTAEHGQP